MSKLEGFEIISTYSLEEAIADGILAKLCDIRWNGVIKPYIATAHVLEDIGQDGAMEIWKEFVDWRDRIMPTLPEVDQLFYTGVDGRKFGSSRMIQPTPLCIRKTIERLPRPYNRSVSHPAR